MNIVIHIRGADSFQLLYSSWKFKTGLTVTGYLIYPDLTKSPVMDFDELGDGVYAVAAPYEKKTQEHDEKYGVVIKENGETMSFGFVRLIN